MAKTQSSNIGGRRFMIAIPLAIVFGFVCAAFAAQSNPGIWWTPLMWTIVTDRLLIGVLIGFAGAFERHPVFRFRIRPFVRGFVLGVIASLTLAFGIFVSPTPGIDPWWAFWMTLVMGGVYGLIIDIVATKFAGEGKALLD